MPGPPLGSGCVGSWSEAGQFCLSPQDLQLPNSYRLAGSLAVTAVTSPCEQWATPGCDEGHRSPPLSPFKLAAEQLQGAPGEAFMAYVITDTCIKDLLCVEVCPTDCIHPKKEEPAFEAATQLYVSMDTGFRRL